MELCWAFSSIAALETANFPANEELVVLSEQQLVDCSKECTQDKSVCNKECTSGSHILAYNYMTNVGIEQAKDYPYTATDTVSINANMMHNYKGGVACPPCTGDFTNLNHAVALVGYGSQWLGEQHWIIKNSWGKKYGEDGYYRLCKGRLTCARDPRAAIPFAVAGVI
ncbi:hypothetical protein Dsin_003594 [Dipteronia sinensis]|uniref:Peptidase C1A papain C-terminal domain-containing protein n=1 Tax=Dipteronia sinensis TaxID=43782 RepID=A0AAE0EKE4_9ROSI|nr:hypothetical protein Dsin_003594 [Dipteronia sinensis]